MAAAAMGVVRRLADPWSSATPRELRWRRCAGFEPGSQRSVQGVVFGSVAKGCGRNIVDVVVRNYTAEAALRLAYHTRARSGLHRPMGMASGKWGWRAIGAAQTNGPGTVSVKPRHESDELT